MKLYYAPVVCSLAVHIVAREADLDLDLMKVDILSHKVEDGSDYLAINPRGYVPLLVLDDGEKVSEVSVLLQFLAELGGRDDLLPPVGSRERLRVLQWVNFVATELHKTFSPWLWHKETAAETKKAARDKLGLRFAEMDAVLAGRRWLAGEEFTIADAYAFTIVSWSNYLAIDLRPYPHLQAYLARVAARPAVQAALAAEGLVRKAA
jgi:glutathione S-transferase